MSEQDQIVCVLMTQSNPETTGAEGAEEVATAAAAAVAVAAAVGPSTVPPSGTDVTKLAPLPIDPGTQGSQTMDQTAGDEAGKIVAGTASTVAGPPAPKITPTPKEEQAKGGAIKKHSSK